MATEAGSNLRWSPAAASGAGGQSLKAVVVDEAELAEVERERLVRPPGQLEEAA